MTCPRSQLANDRAQTQTELGLLFNHNPKSLLCSDSSSKLQFIKEPPCFIDPAVYVLIITKAQMSPRLVSGGVGPNS